MRIPKHIALIPDGNRRWANNCGLEKKEGYEHGLNPGVSILRLAKKYGIEELTYYGFTTDNCKRPKEQVKAFVAACVKAVEMIKQENVDLLVVGNTDSEMFPKELLPYTKQRIVFGNSGIKVNFLVNYGWEWDLSNIDCPSSNRKTIVESIHSKDISRIDLIVRWGGRKRLSGLLPIQSVYADIYTVDDMWPDFKTEQFEAALKWYNIQDVTLGG